MKYLTGEDYKYLCDDCKGAINTALVAVVEGEAISPYGVSYLTDQEGPLMLAGDKGWLCGLGGRECDGPPDEDAQPKPALVFIPFPPTEWENPEYWR